MSFKRRVVPVGAVVPCKQCGTTFESGFQCGRRSTGEFCSLRCSRRYATRAGNPERIERIRAAKLRRDADRASRQRRESTGLASLLDS